MDSIEHGKMYWRDNMSLKEELTQIDLALEMIQKRIDKGDIIVNNGEEIIEHISNGRKELDKARGKITLDRPMFKAFKGIK
jgi:hypothetical protein